MNSYLTWCVKVAGWTCSVGGRREGKENQPLHPRVFNEEEVKRNKKKFKIKPNCPCCDVSEGYECFLLPKSMSDVLVGECALGVSWRCLRSVIPPIVVRCLRR